ncbi:MAG: hypothetical protein AB1342_03240 [Pseudomonadota bacterium]
MRDEKLLKELLDAEDEGAVLTALNARGLLNRPLRWKYLGNMPNNQSIVHAQQSTPTAALVEKFTNGVDAILLRNWKRTKKDARGTDAWKNMAAGIEASFGDLNSFASQDIRKLAEENLLLYATGSKSRPSLSFYDGGEGQLAENFRETFCSLIAGSSAGSYKGAIPFVQGRFNMGGTGVLPFCSEERKLQLVVSRVPDEIAEKGNHEWAYTLFCFFPGRQDPSWKYLVGEDGAILTAGTEPLGLIPKAGAKSGEACAPRERKVSCGTLVKMYDFKAPRSNICGELFKKFEDYLLRPAFPLRLIECRTEYRANVMGVTIWDRLSAWAKNKIESGFEEGASIQIKLSTGETVPAEVRVFKKRKEGEEDDLPQTGLRALINGQSHAKRDAHFFRTKAVDKEHIAGSMLVTLDCTDLGQGSRNALFMSNRETFREDPLLTELLRKLQSELKQHEGLIELNQRRYEEKIADAISDEQGISALEELLSSDPSLADLFGSMAIGKVAAQIANSGTGNKIEEDAQPFVGKDFPTFFKKADGSTSVTVQFARGESTRVSFLTDVKNNYFSRRNYRGKCEFDGAFQPTFRLFNGRLTLTFALEKSIAIGTKFSTVVTIEDAHGSGPFTLQISGEVCAAQEKLEGEKREPNPPKADAVPSRPDVIERENGPDDPPITIEKAPGTERLTLVVNTGSKLLTEAKALRSPEDASAVDFVFKYGLALVSMGLLDAVKKTDQWKSDPDTCRDNIAKSSEGVARVIVPLCLSLPGKLPKAA